MWLITMLRVIIMNSLKSLLPFILSYKDYDFMIKTKNNEQRLITIQLMSATHNTKQLHCDCKKKLPTCWTTNIS